MIYENEFFEDVCEVYGERMHRKDKKAFRQYLIKQAQAMGYPVREDKSFWGTNVVIGEPSKSKTILTAHYDTPPRLPKFFVKHMIFSSFVLLPAAFLFTNFALPSIVADLAPQANQLAVNFAIQASNILGLGGFASYSLGFLGGANKTNFNDNSSGCIALLSLMKQYKDEPENVKNNLCFVFFDNEEKGLLGSSSFAKKYKKVLDTQTVINFDCVGKGDQFNLYYFGKEPPKVVKELDVLNKETGFSTKPVKSSMMSLSDHYPFRKMNHVCVLSTDSNDSKSLYSQIHSSNDTSIDPGNINSLTKLVTQLPEFSVKPRYSLDFLTEQPKNSYARKFILDKLNAKKDTDTEDLVC